jgi:site-specific DNA recombinase
MAAAAAGLIDEIHVLRLDRLGRDEIDRFVIYHRLRELHVRIVSVLEGIPDAFTYGIHTVVDGEARRRFLELTALGIARAARGGRYCGGIVPFGFRTEGLKQTARIVPDDTIVWADKTAVEIVRDIYERIALRGQSCRAVADQFNALGIPTHYTRDGRGVRGKATQGLWRAGRIRSLVINSVYRGELQYGRRIDQRGPKTERTGHEIISAPIEGIVSSALWYTAQAALAANQRMPKNTRRVYMLRGSMKCGICGLNYVGSWSKEFGWYRCNGQLVERGPVPGKCLGVSVRTDRIETAIWSDIEAWLRNPGDVLDGLDGRVEREAQDAIAEAESITFEKALRSLDEQKSRLVRSLRMGMISDSDIAAELAQIRDERAALEARVAAAEAPLDDVVPQAVHDTLSEIRARLDAGLTNAQRQEIVRLLAKIVIHTTIGDDDKKTAKALVTYRFPGVVNTFTGTGSYQNYTTVRRVIELPVGRQRRELVPA